MKRLTQTILAAVVTQLHFCAGTPLTVSYEGKGFGHNYSLAYSSGKGVAAVISAK